MNEGAARSTQGSRRDVGVPLGLVALGLIPLIAGTLRLIQLAGGPDRWRRTPGLRPRLCRWWRISWVRRSS